MYLKTKLNEEISKLKKAQKGKIISSNDFSHANTYANTRAIRKEEATLNNNLEPKAYEQSVFVRLIRWLKERNKTQTFSIEKESKNYPILRLINLYVVNIIFYRSDLNILLKDINITDVITNALFHNITNLITTNYHFGNTNLDTKELKNYAEHLISLNPTKATDEDIYRIICEHNNSTTPESNQALNIRALIVLHDFHYEPIIIIDTEDLIIKLHDDVISTYKIGEDAFDFNGEVYPASKESLQIIDWVNFGAGYFSENFNQPNSCN